jgi:chitinase
MYFVRYITFYWLPVAILLLWQMAVASAQVERQQGAEGQIVVAYWPAWANRSEADMRQLPAGAIHYLVFAFVQPVLDRESGLVSLKFLSEADADTTRVGWTQVAQASGAKTMFSVGGWGLSADFSELTIDPQLRSRLIDCILREIREKGFDGVDLDWEFPVEGGAEGQPHRVEDRESLYQLVGELRMRMNQMGKQTGKRYRLSVAVSGDLSAQEKRYRLAAMAPYVDWFNLMAYDFAGGWIPVTAHTAALFPRQDLALANRALTVSESVACMISLGVPANKIVLGVNLAGKRYDGVAFEGMQFVAKPYDSIHYQSEYEGENNFYFLHKLLEPKAGEKHSLSFGLGWDSESQASYLYNPTERTYISIETPRSVTAKMQFARQQQLLGTMLWSLDKDGEGFPILRSVIGVWPPAEGKR